MDLSSGSGARMRARGFPRGTRRISGRRQEGAAFARWPARFARPRLDVRFRAPNYYSTVVILFLCDKNCLNFD
jgi:hypothetical protein